MWAPRLKVDSCRRCGTSERQHRSGGYCNPCFLYLKYHQKPTRFEREVKALDHMRDVDWAYLAGLIDGEGTVTASAPGIAANGRPRSGRAQLLVSMTFEPVIRWLQESLGGTVWLRAAPTTSQKPVWGWRLDGRKLKPIIERMSPYLKVKHEQAALLTEFIDLQDRPFVRLDQERKARLLAIKSELLRLNHRGAL